MVCINAQRTIDENTHFRVYGICKALVKRTLNRGRIARFGAAYSFEGTMLGEVWVHQLQEMQTNPEPSREQITNKHRRPKMTDPTPQNRGCGSDFVQEVYVRVLDRIQNNRTNPDLDAELWGAAATELFHYIEARRSELPETGEVANSPETPLIKGEELQQLLNRLDPQIWGIINPLAKGIKQSVIAQNEGISQQAISKRLAAA